MLRPWALLVLGIASLSSCPKMFLFYVALAVTFPREVAPATCPVASEASAAGVMRVEMLTQI